VSTITAILDADADGSIHLPLPPELRGGKVKVVAHLEPVNVDAIRVPKFGCLAGAIHLADDFDEPLSDFEDYMK
jgi:hypothetical protein